MLFFLAFHFSLSLTPNCRNWSPNYSVLVLFSGTPLPLPIHDISFVPFGDSFLVVGIYSNRHKLCIFRFNPDGGNWSQLFKDGAQNERWRVIASVERKLFSYNTLSA
jgi:hypothetical protein